MRDDIGPGPPPAVLSEPFISNPCRDWCVYWQWRRVLHRFRHNDHLTELWSEDTVFVPPNEAAGNCLVFVVIAVTPVSSLSLISDFGLLLWNHAMLSGVVV